MFVRHFLEFERRNGHDPTSVDGKLLCKWETKSVRESEMKRVGEKEIVAERKGGERGRKEVERGRKEVVARTAQSTPQSVGIIQAQSV